METNLIKSYHHETFGDVRIHQGSRTPVCFEDVCKVLDIKNTRNVILRLNNSGVHTVDTTTTIDNRGVSHTKKNRFISWGNFCRIVSTSKKEIAIPFQNWMFDEVMESVFTNGGYIVGQSGIDTESFNKAVAERANCVVASAYKERDFWRSVANQQQMRILELEDMLQVDKPT